MSWFERRKRKGRERRWKASPAAFLLPGSVWCQEATSDEINSIAQKAVSVVGADSVCKTLTTKSSEGLSKQNSSVKYL